MQLNICDTYGDRTWAIVGRFVGVLFHFMRQPNQPQFLRQNFEFRLRAIDCLKMCSLKPSELDTISSTLCVFLCWNKYPENVNQTE